MNRYALVCLILAGWVLGLSMMITPLWDCFEIVR